MEVQLFGHHEGFKPMSHGLRVEKDLLAARTAAAPEQQRHLFRLVSLACIMTAAFTADKASGGRNERWSFPLESTATALARYKAFFRLGVKNGAIPKWLSYDAARDAHGVLLRDLTQHLQPGVPLSVGTFAPCYTEFAAAVLNEPLLMLYERPMLL
jgi:hypothetical protein